MDLRDQQNWVSDGSCPMPGLAADCDLLHIESIADWWWTTCGHGSCIFNVIILLWQCVNGSHQIVTQPTVSITKGLWSLKAHAALETAGTLVADPTLEGCVCYTAKRARQPFERGVLNLSCPECAACPQSQKGCKCQSPSDYGVRAAL